MPSRHYKTHSTKGRNIGWILCCLAGLCFGISSQAEEALVVIDPNSTDIRSRQTEGAVTSLCTVLSVPSLEIKDRVVFGENVSGAFIGNRTLVLTGQAIGTSDLRHPEVFGTNQVFAFFSLNPLTKLAQLSLEGNLFSSDPLTPTVETYVKGTSDLIFAVIQPRKVKDKIIGSQQIIGISSNQKTVFKYEIPSDEMFLTTMMPLSDGYLLLNIAPHTGATASTLKLVDIKRGEVIDTVHLRDHIRNIFPNRTSANSCFAITDKPGVDETKQLAIIKQRDGHIIIESADIPLDSDKGQNDLWHGMALDENKILVGVGSYSEIKAMYLINWQSKTAEKLFSFEPKPANFVVTGDGKYVITVGRKEPQVSLYDLDSRALLSTQTNVSANPLILLSN